MFLVGLSLGPPHHYFYTWLDKKFPTKTYKVIGAKIMVICLITCCAIWIIYFAHCITG